MKLLNVTSTDPPKHGKWGNKQATRSSDQEFCLYPMVIPRSFMGNYRLATQPLSLTWPLLYHILPGPFENYLSRLLSPLLMFNLNPVTCFLSLDWASRISFLSSVLTNNYTVNQSPHSINIHQHIGLVFFSFSHESFLLSKGMLRTLFEGSSCPIRFEMFVPIAHTWICYWDNCHCLWIWHLLALVQQCLCSCHEWSSFDQIARVIC